MNSFKSAIDDGSNFNAGYKSIGWMLITCAILVVVGMLMKEARRGCVLSPTASTNCS
ncbi:MAG: hypothetical protein ABL872_10470 [Lacibacter sp.]